MSEVGRIVRGMTQVVQSHRKAGVGTLGIMYGRAVGLDLHLYNSRFLPKEKVGSRQSAFTKYKGTNIKVRSRLHRNTYAARGIVVLLAGAYLTHTVPIQ